MAKERLSAMDIGDLRRRIREADQAGDRQKQVELLRQLCEHEVNDLRSRQRLGHLLKDLGYDAEATRELQRCASGYATEGFLNRAIQIVKTLVEFNPGDQVALRALQGLYARRQSSSPSVGPIPGFEPAPFDPVSAGEDHTSRLEELGREQTDPNLSVPPRLGFVRARRTAEFEAVEPERDLGDLVASAMELEDQPSDEDGQGRSITLPLFGALPERAQAEILETMESHRFESGEYMFHQGETDPKLWMLRSGRVEVRRRVGDEEQMLARLGHGAVLGEMSIFDDSPRSASAITLGKVSAYSMTRQHLEKIWAQYPMVHKTLLKNYRLRHLRNLVAYAPFMQFIPEDHRRGVAMLFRVREVPAGAVLIGGDEPEEQGILGVLGGRVRVEYRAPAGELRQLAILGPGSLFGYDADLLGLEQPFRYVTNGRASILRMNVRSMRSLLQAHQPLETYLKELAERRRDSAQRIVAAQNDFAT